MFTRLALKRFLYLTISVSVLCSVLSHAAFSDDDNESSSEVEKEVSFTLVPPPGTTSDAKGEAEIAFKQDDEKQEQEQELKLKLTGLEPLHDYGMRVVLSNSTTPVTVPDVRLTTDEEGDLEVKFVSEKSSTPSDGDDEDSDEDHPDLPLPAGLDPVTNIEQIDILDLATSGTVVLTGKLGEGEEDAELDETVSLDQPTTALRLGVSGSSSATGSARISLLRRAGKPDEEFHVQVVGLEPKTAYRVKVNRGLDLGAIKTNGRGLGSVTLKSGKSKQKTSLPAALTPITNVKIVEILDFQNRVVLRGAFR